MSKPIERIVKTNGISLNVVEQGQGPLVLLCHGFPEIAYSWRRQHHDMVVASPGAAEQIANMKEVVPLLRDIHMLPRCGHWTQQERPAEVSAAIIEFLRSPPSEPFPRCR